MIPTIEDILSDLAAGTISAAQARAWIDQHLELAALSASENADLRDHFAAQAMLGVMTEPISGSQSLTQYLTETAPGDAENKGARFARASYVMADAMIKARQA